jgi:hypothetical protein
MSTLFFDLEIRDHGACLRESGTDKVDERGEHRNRRRGLLYCGKCQFLEKPGMIWHGVIKCTPSPVCVLPFARDAHGWCHRNGI